MTLTPGTVSTILWHFTGGPLWDSAKKCQELVPKPQEKAYQALLAILESKQLRLGSYSEVFKVTIPVLKKRSRDTKKLEELHNVQEEVPSSPVCCVADIPIIHLPYHAQRYGKFALGFRRESVIRGQFNPVLYTLENSPVANAIRNGIRALESVDSWYIDDLVSSIELDVGSLQCEEGHDVEPDTSINSNLADIQSEAESMVKDVEKASEALSQFLAFVKTFKTEEFASIYCEREWRATKAFAFTPADIAMIVLPTRGESGKDFLADLIRDHSERLGVPRSVPIVAWEDLLEH